MLIMSKSFENNVPATGRTLEIASLTDHLDTPSSRFRVRQHFENLAQQQINVTDFPRLWSTQSAGEIFPNKRIRSSIPKLLTAGAFELFNLANSFSRIAKTRSYDSTWISRELVVGYPTF